MQGLPPRTGASALVRGLVNFSLFHPHCGSFGYMSSPPDLVNGCYTWCCELDEWDFTHPTWDCLGQTRLWLPLR